MIPVMPDGAAGVGSIHSTSMLVTIKTCFTKLWVLVLHTCTDFLDHAANMYPVNGCDVAHLET